MAIKSTIKSHFQRIKAWYLKYERWLMPVTLAVGFVADYVTFVNIQINTALVILFVYWVICALAITFVYTFDAGKMPEKYRFLRLFAPLLIQFTFGGLLSNSFIFYWFSGSIWVSWPFVLAFVILMVSNDALRRHFLKPTVQLSVFYFATFSIFSVTLPFVFNSLNPWLFVLSGGTATLLIALFILALKLIAKNETVQIKNIVIAISVILAITNFFYFTNLIPPVPLAMREMGIYHSVIRSGSKYILTGEPESFWQKLIPGQTVHLTSGERTYVFSSIFAPKHLNTSIVHEWQYYDEGQSKWIIKEKLSFNLFGGRREGFRGYSLKTNLPLGNWRVFVKTPRGQTLGRIKFEVKRAETPMKLIEEVK